MGVNVLELFAGIGGGALALKAAGCRSVGYCEISPANQAVLESNIALGRLDDAPIFPDVTKLKGSQVRGRVDMISGGFPCQGVSSLGKKAGVYGDHRSRLVRHVYRLIDELKPTYVFLENTPHILSDPNYADILREFSKRNFHVAFVIRTASQAGAAHQRARWFLLAQKAGKKPSLQVPRGALKRLSALFSKQPRSKLVLHTPTLSRFTCRAFGNSVVPAQALSALQILADMLRAPPKDLRTVGLPPPARLTATLARDGQLWQPERRKATETEDSTKCQGSGFNVVPPRDPGSPQRKLARLTKPFTVQCMPTARTASNCCTAGRSMTARSSRDPANLLLSAREMYPDGVVPPDSVRRRLAVSPEFWAVAFGFPRDWINKPLALACAERGEQVRAWP